MKLTISRANILIMHHDFEYIGQGPPRNSDQKKFTSTTTFQYGEKVSHLALQAGSRGRGTGGGGATKLEDLAKFAFKATSKQGPLAGKIHFDHSTAIASVFSNIGELHPRPLWHLLEFLLRHVHTDTKYPKRLLWHMHVQYFHQWTTPTCNQLTLRRLASM